MRKTIIFILVCTLVSSVQAKDSKLKYIAGLIPDSLKKNAHAVIRKHHEKVEILSLSKTRTTIHIAITVLKEAGKSKGWMQIPYNSDSKITDLSAKAYNALGFETEKWNKNNWKDVGYDTYGTAYSDYRMKLLKPGSNNYPYTIEYKYSYEESNTYSIDSWFPLQEDNLSVMESSYELVYCPEVDIKYQPYNFNDVIKKTEGENTIKWEVTNIKALNRESYRPPIKYLVPYLRVGLNQFKYGDYIGQSRSWEEFGKFRKQLLANKQELPDSRKKEIDQVISNYNDEITTIKALYKYMQSHTRYVNISEGIGGIQPFSAKTVSDNGYGDCKALSNYMKAILKYAGFKSHYAVIYAGPYDYEFDKNFVTHQTNHAILCVPLASDTIWLECTSQSMPCGFLGNFTDNRTALIITEGGGQLVKTPKYDKRRNRILRNMNVSISESGSAKAIIHSKYTGLEYDNKHYLTTEDKESQLKILYRQFDIPNFKIIDFKLDQTDEIHPLLNEEITLELGSYASKSGSRLFVPLNVISKLNNVPADKRKRKYEIYKKSEYCQLDSISYDVPNGFKVEVLPPKVEIKNSFGAYLTETTIIDGKIIHKRQFESNSGIFPAQDYNEFVEFHKQIQKIDNTLVVLKKTE